MAEQQFPRGSRTDTWDLIQAFNESLAKDTQARLGREATASQSELEAQRYLERLKYNRETNSLAAQEAEKRKQEALREAREFEANDAANAAKRREDQLRAEARGRTSGEFEALEAAQKRNPEVFNQRYNRGRAEGPKHGIKVREGEGIYALNANQRGDVDRDIRRATRKNTTPPRIVVGRDGKTYAIYPSGNAPSIELPQVSPDPEATSDNPAAVTTPNAAQAPLGPRDRGGPAPAGQQTVPERKPPERLVTPPANNPVVRTPDYTSNSEPSPQMGEAGSLAADLLLGAGSSIRNLLGGGSNKPPVSDPTAGVTVNPEADLGPSFSLPTRGLIDRDDPTAALLNGRITTPTPVMPSGTREQTPVPTREWTDPPTPEWTDPTTSYEPPAVARSPEYVPREWQDFEGEADTNEGRLPITRTSLGGDNNSRADPESGGLRGKVYNAFRDAGFSHGGALALAAEVGRENSFNPNLVFGTHSDPHNRATNGGLFSWQGDRRTKLNSFLKSKGLMDDSGRMSNSDDAIKAMAEFTRLEMGGMSPGLLAYLQGDNVDRERAARGLGDIYIKWRRTDPRYAHHNQVRDRHYDDVARIVSGGDRNRPKARPTGDPDIFDIMV